MNKTVEVIIKVDNTGAVEEVVTSDPDIVFYTVNKENEIIYGPYSPDKFLKEPLRHIKTREAIIL